MLGVRDWMQQIITEENQNLIEQGLKRCSKCGEWKEKVEFWKKNNSKDGCQCFCKQCQKEILQGAYAAHYLQVVRK